MLQEENIEIDFGEDGGIPHEYLASKENLTLGSVARKQHTQRDNIYSKGQLRYPIHSARDISTSLLPYAAFTRGISSTLV